MSQVTQIQCPNCDNVLRIPPNIGEASIKCKYCAFVLTMKKKAGAPKSAAPAPPVGQAAAKAIPVGKPVSAQKPVKASGPLPEYTPPATRPTPTQTKKKASGPASGKLAPIVEILPEPGAANLPSNATGQKSPRKGGYKGPRNSNKVKWIAVSSVFLLGAIIVGFIVLKRDSLEKKLENAEKNAVTKNDSNSANTIAKLPTQIDLVGKRPPTATQLGPMPRRLLAINITNYLYMNSLQYGINQAENDRDRRDFYKVIERMATGWRIPKEQVYFLTDGPTDNNKVDSKHPPLKSIVQGTIDRFLSTSRPQDRIIITFSGHAMEQDGEAYLVPLEGELEDVTTMIPLKEFYDKLAKCPAQEKIVIFDVCRYDPGRGVEKPAFGMMTEGLEKALHNCPDGVCVWTSCSKDQYSYEYDYAQIAIPGLRAEMWGSIFFSLFFTADVKKSALNRGVGNPNDPLPMDVLRAFIDTTVPNVMEELEKVKQTPKFTAKPRKEWIAYNREQAVPPHFELPLPPPTAKREEILAMFRESGLPDIRAIRKEEKEQKLADSFPFTEAAIKPYAEDKPTFEDIQKSPEKYEKDFPLRVATVQAILEMKKLKQDDPREELPERFNSPINDGTKAAITNKYQRTIAGRQGVLEDQRDSLEAAGKKRDMEKSKRWQANYDYAYAQARLRLAYISEYNLALGKVKLEQLPELDVEKKFQKGWQLKSVEKMMSPKEIRDMAEDAKKDLTELAKSHPNTPWAVLAKSQKSIVLGLSWQPSSFGVSD